MIRSPFPCSSSSSLFVDVSKPYVWFAELPTNGGWITLASISFLRSGALKPQVVFIGPSSPLVASTSTERSSRLRFGTLRAKRAGQKLGRGRPIQRNILCNSLALLKLMDSPQLHESTEDQNAKRSRKSKWDVQGDMLLLNILAEEQLRMNCPIKNFKSHTWDKMCTVFNHMTTDEKTTVKQLKGRLKTLKKLYSLYASLANLSGWTWDHNLHYPTPHSEDVWDSLLDSDSRYKNIKNKPFPQYYKMADLVGKTTATGEYCSGLGCPWSSTKEGTDSSDDPEDGNLPRTPPINLDSDTADMSMHEKSKKGDSLLRSSKRKSACASGKSTAKKRTPDNSDEILGKILQLGESRTAYLAKAAEVEDKFSYHKAIEKLKSMEDITGQQMVIAGRALKDRDERVFFLEVEDSIARTWIELQERIFSKEV